MSVAASLLPELDDVIRHGSSVRRVHTLMRVAALFAATAENLRSEHVDLFDDVFCRLLAEVHTVSRIDLSKQLAPIDNAPPRTVRRLANDDEPAVAQAVLRQSRHLGDTELIGIARSKSQAHLLLLAGRSGISELVTDILLQRGNRDVLRALVDNATAQFSEGSLEVLIEEAASDNWLADKLVLRRDLPPRILRETLKHTSKAGQERLLATSNPELQEEIKRPLAMADRTAGSAEPRDYAAAETRIRQMRQSGTLDEAAVIDLASKSQYEETVAALASLCALPITVADRIVGGDRTDPILILCRSAGWSWPTARAIMGLMPSATGSTEQALDATYVNFERLSPTTAQRVLRFWQVHQWGNPAILA
jgi:uncharacterized protein (DUF2336 family)